jgi:hypothetical protein
MRWTWPALAVLAATAAPGASGTLQWQAYQHVPGVFDVAGPLPDGRVVVAGSAQLLALDPATGRTSVLGPEGDQGGEAYIAASPSPGAPVDGASCTFAPGEVYQLRLGGSPGVIRIAEGGAAHPFADLPSAGSLNGIAFDTTGRFGHRLLVTGSHAGGSTVVALDCSGQSRVVTDHGPTLEGGLAVAPAGFGAYAGDLVAPDELSGNLLAVRPDGSSAVIASSGLPTGQDVGVESLGFVPPRFLAGGHAFLADRATANNPHGGTDTLLRLDADELARAGVREGDLLAATEGGDVTIGVHCAAVCRVYRVGQASAGAHGEGHLLLQAEHPGAAGSLPADRDLGGAARGGGVAWQAVALALIAALAVAGGLGAWLARRNRRRRPEARPPA